MVILILYFLYWNSISKIFLHLVYLECFLEFSYKQGNQINKIMRIICLHAFKTDSPFNFLPQNIFYIYYFVWKNMNFMEHFKSALTLIKPYSNKHWQIISYMYDIHYTIYVKMIFFTERECYVILDKLLLGVSRNTKFCCL
jgi:hypothetical protein